MDNENKSNIDKSKVRHLGAFGLDMYVPNETFWHIAKLASRSGKTITQYLESLDSEHLKSLKLIGTRWGNPEIYQD